MHSRMGTGQWRLPRWQDDEIDGVWGLCLLEAFRAMACRWDATRLREVCMQSLLV